MWTNNGSFFYRNQLSAQGKTFYDLLYRRISTEDYRREVLLPTTDCKHMRKDAREAYFALFTDHPEFFFLSHSMYSAVDIDGDKIYLDILYPDDQIHRIQRQIQRKIKEILRNTALLPRLSAEKIIYARIASMLSYRNHHDCRDHNVVGPVLASSGVCEGHNALLMLCYRAAGIPCIKVSGYSKRRHQPHCWTMALIDGCPVHCDVTWDCAEGDRVWFDYFNLCDEELNKTHENYRRHPIPVCTASHLTCFRASGWCFDTPEEMQRYIRRKLEKNPSRAVYLQPEFPASQEELLDLIREVLSDFPGDFMIHFGTTLHTAVLYPTQKGAAS